MKVRKVSLIIFYDENKRILMQNRKNMMKWGEIWGFFGGEIEEDETPEQAVIRETKEELDFKLENYEYIGKTEGKIKDLLHVIAHIYVSPIENKIKKFNQNEGCGMEFFSIKEAKQLKLAGEIDINILEKMRMFLENEN